MKILQSVHSFPPSSGGIEHHVYHLSRELHALGNEVVVITTRDEGTAGEEDFNGVKVKRFFSIDFPIFSSARLPLFAFFAMLRENPDVYASHGYGSIMPLFASIAALLNRKPFVFTLHGYPEVKGAKRVFYYFYKFFIASIFLRIAKKVIVVSKASIPIISKECDPKKIIYVPNGIEDVFDCNLDYEKKNKITYVGRLDEDKGVDVLIRAFAKIKKYFPELELQLVGKDEGIKGKLEALANSLNIKPYFMEVPYHQMPEVYCESKAIVLPSKYEGFSLVWLEAIASGRPMFSTPVGEAPYLFEQAYGEKKERFLFKNEDELVVKLLRFLKSQKTFKKTIEKAKYIAKEEYSWGNVARLTENVYLLVAKK
jgi:glycosyltransferase involved in cell wall biosynthesis